MSDVAEENDEVGMCEECKNTLNEAYVIRQLKKGFDTFSCNFCGGVARVVKRVDVERLKASFDGKRGIDHDRKDAG